VHIKCQACGIHIGEDWYCQLSIEIREKMLCDACADSWEFLDSLAKILVDRQSTWREFKRGEIEVEDE